MIWEHAARLCIVGAALAIMVGMSVYADRRFARFARLPMQWSVSGAVNWTAPRRLAVCFTPSLAAAMLLPVALTDIRARLLAVAGLSVAVHALHLWLVARWARRGGT